MEEQQDLLINKKFQLWVSLTQLRKIIVKSRDKFIYPQKISPTQGAALYYIYTHPEGVTVKILSNILFLNHSSVSELLSKMENKGWIKRVKDGTDYRQSKITLTKEGKEACYQGGQPEHIYKIFSILSIKQLEQLESMLEMLKREALKDFNWRL